MSTPANATALPAPAPKSALQSFIEKFTILRSAPREVWVIFGQKIVESFAYQLISMGIVIYLSKEFGYSDTKAGWIYGIWSTAITATTLFVGSLVDAIGVRRSFLAGFGLCVVGRGVLAFAPQPFIAMAFGMAPLAVGLALMVPVMAAGLRRYTNKGQRSIAFSLFYTLMNFGFFFGSVGFDAIRSLLGENGSLSLPMGLGVMSTYRVLFLVSTLATVVGLLFVLLFMREGVEMSESGEEVKIDKEKKPENPARIFMEVVRESAFWRFMLFLLLLVGVRLVFFHMHVTFPKYAIRAIGPDAKIGTIWGINMLGIFILVPIIGALTQKVSSYRMMTIGSLIAGPATLLLLLPADWFTGFAAWMSALAGTQIHALYVPLTLFVILFTIGEAIWSPRLYEYTASIAPKGREGSYMALSLLPMFVAKMVAGPLSGWLLQNYCPEGGPYDQAWVIWAVVAGMALITPISIIGLRRVIQPDEDVRH